MNDYVMDSILDRTSVEGRTVKNILGVIKEKYDKTFTEKTQEMVMRIIGLKRMEENESGEIWDKFYKVVE